MSVGVEFGVERVCLKDLEFSGNLACWILRK